MVDWHERALEIRPWYWFWDAVGAHHRAWQSARNGFADGQALGRELASFWPYNIEMSGIHIIAHSNGSAFAAGITDSWNAVTGEPITQLTVLDAPSEAGEWYPQPPTGWFVMNQLDANPQRIVYFDSWIVQEGPWFEFGDRFGVERAANIELNWPVTSWISWFYNEAIPHHAIANRYALSADKRDEIPIRGLQYSYEEPFGFGKTSILGPGSVKSEPGNLVEDATKHPPQNWFTWDDTPDTKPSMSTEMWLDLISPQESWRGINAYASGSEESPEFLLAGEGDLYVEFDLAKPVPLDPGYYNRLEFDILCETAITEPMYVYAGLRDSLSDRLEYIGTVNLNEDAGNMYHASFLVLPASKKGPVSFGMWLCDSGTDVRELTIMNITVSEVEFTIVGQ